MMKFTLQTCDVLSSEVVHDVDPGHNLTLNLDSSCMKIANFVSIFEPVFMKIVISSRSR